MYSQASQKVTQLLRFHVRLKVGHMSAFEKKPVTVAHNCER